MLIDEKNYNDLAIYFARYNKKKSMKMLPHFYHNLVGKIDKLMEKLFDA